MGGISYRVIIKLQNMTPFKSIEILQIKVEFVLIPPNLKN